MRNLYVVAIGGSGERVMRSLIMLLTSGVKVNAQQIVPVFIENDINSHALGTCMRLLKYYNNNAPEGKGLHTIYNSLGANSDEWPSFCKTKIADPITLNQAGDAVGTLADVIGHYDSNQAIFDRIDEERNILFSPEDLNMPLTVGFVGNPNIGSVVLNSLSLNDVKFDDIKSSCSPNDGLIVVGSLFGGTGAAGIPLVVNSINEWPDQNRPILGTIAMLPYFVTNTGSGEYNAVINTAVYDVQSNAFDAKTRAALMYYAEYMKDMDCMYYVGDSKHKDVYPHCVGGRHQENRAHLVELMSALSIVDFAKRQKRSNDVDYKRPIWGINVGENAAALPANISSIRNKDLARSLVKFRMMMQLFKDEDFIKRGVDEKQPYVQNIGFTDDMRKNVITKENAANDVTAWGLNHIMEEWTKWMDELNNNSAKRKFAIYNDQEPATDKNLTSKFYSETGFGVAKTKWIRTGILGLGEKVEVAVDADIQEALYNAYKKLYPQGSKNDASGYLDEQRLPRLLQIISQALDEVIDQRCIDAVK